MKSLPITTILFFLLLISCNRNQQRIEIVNNKTQTIEINNIDTTNFFDLKKIYSTNINLVSLDYTPKSIIGNIDKILTYNDLIFIFDKKISKNLYVFNKKGEFITSINELQIGDIDDFSIDNQSLLILNTLDKKITSLNISKNYEVERVIYFKIDNIYEISAFDNKIFCYRKHVENINKNNVEASTLFLLDNKGEVLKHWLPSTVENKYLTFYGTYPSLLKVENKVFISRALDDNLYVYNHKTEQLEIKYNLDFKKNSISDDAKKATSLYHFEAYMNKDNFSYNLGKFFEIYDYSFMMFKEKNNLPKQGIITGGTVKTFGRFIYGNTNLIFTKIDALNEKELYSNIPVPLLFQIQEHIKSGNKFSSHYDDFFLKINTSKTNPILIYISK